MAAIGTWMSPAHRARCVLMADVFAAALAVVLPWSTSAVSILVVLWLIVFIPTLDLAQLRRVLCTPAGGLPVLLWILALLGLLWAFDIPMKERLDGLKSFHKLLFIPLLMVHVQRSERAAWAMIGFVASCIVLLAMSWAEIALPYLPLPVSEHGGRGVPVKDSIAQNAEFIACMFLLAPVAWRAWRDGRRGLTIAIVLLDLVFLADIFDTTTSRTALVILPLLLFLFAGIHLSWKGTLGLLLASVVIAAGIWSVAPSLRGNVTGMFQEMREFQPGGERTRAGERLEFWTKSIGFVSTAPILGHGTGSIRDQFRKAAGQTGMAALEAANPHNQTFAVAIQLGLIGTIVLFAMWMAHALLVFRGTGLAAWAGVVIVTQNIVGSLFNSHLFDFTQGWGYVIGFGIAAGALLREQARRSA